MRAPQAADPSFVQGLRQACVVGRDRTLWHDPESGFKQLVEMALRALSPGVNEPFTALTCIDGMSQSLAAAATAPPPLAVHRDQGGAPRLFLQPQPFKTLLRGCFEPIRLFAGSNPAVYARLIEVLAELALLPGLRSEDRAELQGQAQRVMQAARRSLLVASDLEYVEARDAHCAPQFSGRPAGTRRPG